jgi:hypothetical protein
MFWIRIRIGSGFNDSVDPDTVRIESIWIHNPVAAHPVSLDHDFCFAQDAEGDPGEGQGSARCQENAGREKGRLNTTISFSIEGSTQPLNFQLKAPHNHLIFNSKFSFQFFYKQFCQYTLFKI